MSGNSFIGVCLKPIITRSIGYKVGVTYSYEINDVKRFLYVEGIMNR